MPVARLPIRHLYRPGQGGTRHHQPGPLRDSSTKWADRGPSVGRYTATELMAEREPGPMRGVRESESTTRTTFWRGNYESDPELREEFLNIARSHANGRLS